MKETPPPRKGAVMSATVLTVPGTVTADGALELDAKLNLPPGRVTVTVQPTAAPPPAKDPFIEGLERIRANLRAMGHVPRSVEEVEAEREEFRREWDEHQEALERLQEECWRIRNAAKGTDGGQAK
jgi:hypothetical protein